MFDQQKKKNVRGRGPKTMKSHRGQWLEDDMTIDPTNTTNDRTEQQIGQELSTWDEYFEKIVVFECYVCRGKKQFK